MLSNLYSYYFFGLFVAVSWTRLCKMQSSKAPPCIPPLGKTSWSFVSWARNLQEDWQMNKKYPLKTILLKMSNVKTAQWFAIVELVSSIVLLTDILNNVLALHYIYLIVSPSTPCAGTTLGEIVLINVTGGGGGRGRDGQCGRLAPSWY